MVTEQSLVLADQHKAAQDQLSAGTMLAVLATFGALNPLDIDGTTTRWLQLVLAIITSQRARSASLTSRYLAAMRVLEVGRATPFVPEPAAEVDVAAVTTSLMVTGPVALRRLIETQREADIAAAAREWTARQRDEDMVEDFGDLQLPGRRPPAPIKTREIAGNVARAAQRHVQNGSRDTVDNALRTDARTVGWVRRTGPNPCFWCAMLASRGPVYKGDSFEDSDPRFTGEGNHKVHDGCQCDLMPVYNRDADNAWQDQAREWEKDWLALTRDPKNPKRIILGGKAAVIAWRRAYEGRSPAAA